MNSKNCIRILVLAALVAWPAVETYRLHLAKQELAASVQLRNSVSTKLAEARVRYAQANVTEEESVR